MKNRHRIRWVLTVLTTAACLVVITAIALTVYAATALPLTRGYSYSPNSVTAYTIDGRYFVYTIDGRSYDTDWHLDKNYRVVVRDWTYQGESGADVFIRNSLFTAKVGSIVYNKDGVHPFEDGAYTVHFDEGQMFLIYQDGGEKQVTFDHIKGMTEINRQRRNFISVVLPVLFVIITAAASIVILLRRRKKRRAAAHT